MTGVTWRNLGSFPRNRLLEDELIRCRAQELDLLGTFGTPMTRAVQGDGTPVFYWDLEWSCELVMGLEFDQLTEVLTVRLDRPETEHALRHLGFEVTDTWSLEKDAPGRFAELPGHDDRAWQLWRQDDNGNVELVRQGLAERDAHCRERELEVRGHKQTYWVTEGDPV